MKITSMEAPNTPGTLISRLNPERENGATVWKEFVISEYTATMNDAFAGTTRLRLATYGEARNNIA
jgi:hypothetical protein